MGGYYFSYKFDTSVKVRQCNTPQHPAASFVLPSPMKENQQLLVSIKGWVYYHPHALATIQLKIMENLVSKCQTSICQH